MAYERLDYTVEDAVATIRLTRVEARNSMDMVLKRELAEVIERAGTDAAVRAVVVTGSGSAFCAGGDVSEMDLNTDPVTSRARLRSLLATVYLPLAEMEKSTIAAVNGHCHGSGLSLMMACDLAIVADDAMFSCAFVKVGLLPDCGAMYFPAAPVGDERGQGADLHRSPLRRRRGQGTRPGEPRGAG